MGDRTRISRRAVMLGMGAAWIAGCGGDGDPAEQQPEVAELASLGELLKADDDLQYFQRSVEQARFEEQLEGGAEHTLFVPLDDDAFRWLKDIIPGELEWFFSEQALDANEFLYHVVRGRLLRRDLPLNELTTLQGQTLRVSADGEVVDAQGRRVQIVGSERLARNGVIHLIAGVVLPAPPPPAEPLRSLLTEARFSTLAAWIDHLLLGTTRAFLADGAPFTFFAPTNDAFERLFVELGVTKQQFFERYYRWSEVRRLETHQATLDLGSTDIDSATLVPTRSGHWIKFERLGDDLQVASEGERLARVTTADIRDGRGIVHVIDNLLDRTFDTAFSVLWSEAGYSIAAQLVDEAYQIVDDGFGEQVSDLGAETVLAPSDEAFAAYFAEVGTTEEAFLSGEPSVREAVIRNHLIGYRMILADIARGSPVATLGGLSITVDGEGRITDPLGHTAEIVRRDWLTYDSVVHLIDRVLLAE